jgi:hypothetical protein
MEKKLKDDFDYLSFGVRRSIRYHVKRQQFFDRLDAFTSFFNVVLGSAAVLALLRGNPSTQVPVQNQGLNLTTFDWIGVYAAALVTILSAIELVVGYARKSRQHEKLGCKFIDLERRMITERNDPNFSEANLAVLTGERLNIEAEEPPPKIALDSICHNELLRADGNENKNEYVQLTRLQRAFAQFFDLFPDTITKPNQPRT